MERSSRIVSDLQNIYWRGVKAVQAESLFQKENFHVSDDKTKIICNFNENQLMIDINNKQCHLIGFGKAVYGMANECSKVLENRLKSGILNVPLKTMETFPNIELPKSIQVFESARNNIPDSDAEYAASKMIECIQTLGQDDVLFIMISGGGSALLPVPCPNVSLAQKQELIKILAKKGATISDINGVRTDLSQTKGGKLTFFTKNVSSVIVFIISDIVGDPIHLIASGPTVQNTQKNISSINILEKYDLWDTLHENIKEAIVRNSSSEQMSDQFNNITNMIIANNKRAVNAIADLLNEMKILGIVLSITIEGNVTDISRAYYELCESILLLKSTQLNEHEFDKRIESLKSLISIRDSFKDEIKQIVHQSKAEEIDLCIICSGEPTVEVNGDGLGGRNQELALRFSTLCYGNSILDDVWFLSAGTDGIDGMIHL